jgi:uncharacterized protein (TIGR02646 family)
MRPIDKTPNQGPFQKYEDAQQPLTTQLGEYCSYCERWIASAIHVEHKLPKNDYPAEKLKWENFLLSCSNCNSGKGHGLIDLDEFVWPDADNTFRAFQYDAEGRVRTISGFGPQIDANIQRTWLMLGFNRHTDHLFAGVVKPTKKDHRWSHRQKAWETAVHVKNGLAICDTPERRAEIAEIATQRGMFSIWMTVFKDDADIRHRLIAAFKGTAAYCFDGASLAIPRPGRAL